MDAVRKLDHFGTSILFVNLSGKDRAEMLARIAAMREAVAKAAPRSALVLTDVQNAMVDEEVIKTLGEAVKANAPQVRASAVVGLTPQRQQLRQLIEGLTGRDFKTFDDVEPALDWLAEQGRAAGTA
jgi:ribosomal protein L12E/L44/L45/RPP1/RPP2